jgi:glutathione S-transferase
VSQAPYVLHGLKLSYFTGKLEGYLRAKGVPFRYVEMDLADFRACARATGVAQMPQLQAPDGSWLTDTTAILAHFEETWPEPALQPTDPAAAFLSLFLEDAFDEWLWRAALYYRWAFAEDARLMSRQIARTMMRDMKAPLWLRRRFILARQRREFLTGDGVTHQTAPTIEALYAEVLDTLEPILSARPYLFGERPAAADFGLFGPFFRHFSHDPTPHAILRERAPAVMAWVARLWAARPEALAAAPRPTTAPADLDPLLALAVRDHLPELAAHEAALAAGERDIALTMNGVPWRYPASPYRAACLNSLRARFASLDAAAQAVVADRLGPAAAVVQSAPVTTPAPPPTRAAPRNRHWR